MKRKGRFYFGDHDCTPRKGVARLSDVVITAIGYSFLLLI